MKNSINNSGSCTFHRSMLAAAMLAAFAASGAYAATITVDPTAVDAAVAGDGKCSLREAVLSVNAGANKGDCVAVVAEAYGTNDTINLPAGTYKLTLAGLDETYDSGKPPTDLAAVVNTPDASKGDLDLTNNVTVLGAGSGTTKIQWDPAATSSASADRIFHVYNATDPNKALVVGIQGVTLENGKTFEVNVAPGSTPGTNYYLRRAGGALAVGPAAAIVLVDPSITGQENTAGRGGSKPEGSPIVAGTTYTFGLIDVIVEHNRAQGDGGGIYTAAPLFTSGTTVRSNTALTNGGGIYNESNSLIIASTISGNTAEGGAGLFNAVGWGPQQPTLVFIYGVTLSGNTAVVGGGITNRPNSTIVMANSTISGNIGSGASAGLNTYGSANLNFVTIARNLAGPDSQTQGSGINITNPYLFPSNSLTTLKNVLFEGNKRDWTAGMDAAAIAALPSANCGDTGSGVTVTSQGTNLSSDAACIPWLNAANDKNNVDPKLDVLADNGGPTLTHKLLAGSPAIAAATADPDVTEDQRGVARDAVPDIGAYEDPALVVPPSTPPPSTTPPTTDTSSSSDGGGGGCTTSPNAAFDPGLLGLLVAAVSGLFLRRQRERKTK
jgi:hypothetical protein